MKPPEPPDRAETGVSRAWDWYTGLPRASVVLIAIAVFLFAINVFTASTGSGFNGPLRCCC